MVQQDTPPSATRRRTMGIQERGKTTRRNLIRTATKLWGERGFEAVTVEDICRAAGVGRTTFYLHFESKDRLLAGLAAATRDGVASDLAEQGDGPLADQLEAFIAGLVRRMEDVPRSLAELVMHSYRVQLVGGASKQGEGDMRRFADLLREVLAAAQQRGELVGSADTTEMGEMLGALTMDAIESWASGRAGTKPLPTVLRTRFALVVEPHLARRRTRQRR